MIISDFYLCIYWNNDNTITVRYDNIIPTNMVIRILYYRYYPFVLLTTSSSLHYLIFSEYVKHEVFKPFNESTVIAPASYQLSSKPPIFRISFYLTPLRNCGYAQLHVGHSIKQYGILPVFRLLVAWKTVW